MSGAEHARLDARLRGRVPRRPRAAAARRRPEAVHPPGVRGGAGRGGGRGVGRRRAHPAHPEGAELFFARLERDPRRCALLLTTGSGPLGERLAELRDTTVERIAGLIAVRAPELADPARCAAAARVVVGAAEELARWWLRSPDVPREHVVAHFRTFVTPGLLAAIERAR